MLFAHYKRKQDEIAERQKQREREAEENLARRRQQQTAAPSPLGLRSSANAWRPSKSRMEGEGLNRSTEADGNKTSASGRWGSSDRPNVRETGRPAGSVESSTAENRAPPSRVPGKYVPPAARRA
jgi:hypothetical protein